VCADIIRFARIAACLRADLAILEKAVVRRSIRIRHIAAWIACFAILLAALAPTVSRILAATCDAPLARAEICATHGDEMAQEEDHSAHHSSAPAGKELHFDHCPFCATHAGSFGLAPVDALPLPEASGAPMLPPLFYQSPRPLFAWATPQPRAPPAHS